MYYIRSFESRLVRQISCRSFKWNERAEQEQNKSRTEYWKKNSEKRDKNETPYKRTRFLLVYLLFFFFFFCGQDQNSLNETERRTRTKQIENEITMNQTANKPIRTRQYINKQCSCWFICCSFLVYFIYYMFSLIIYL